MRGPHTSHGSFFILAERKEKMFFPKDHEKNEECPVVLGRLMFGEFVGRLRVDPDKGLCLFIDEKAIESGNIRLISFEHDNLGQIDKMNYTFLNA